MTFSLSGIIFLNTGQYSAVVIFNSQTSVPQVQQVQIYWAMEVQQLIFRATDGMFLSSHLWDLDQVPLPSSGHLKLQVTLGKSVCQII